MPKSNTNRDAKSRILDTADRLFYQQGYQRTGVNQLIDEAGVAKASFYSNFSSKKNLLKAYLEKRHREWFKSLNNVLTNYNTPEEKVVGLFEFLDSWITETGYRGCTFININSEFPDDNDLISPIVQNHKEQLRELIKKLITDIYRDQKSQEEIELLSDTVYLLVEGAIVESQNYRNIWPVQRALKAVKQLL